jgi:Meckel syndrome type 1 protein
LNADTGDQTTVATDDAAAVQSDANAQAFTGIGAQGGGPTATASTPGAPQTQSAGADTAANLSAQIVQKLSGQSTRFDVQLNPDGLGRVDVAVQIDAKGVLSASLSFEKPEAANLLRDHAGALQQSLAQAGFDLSNGSLSFFTANQDGRSGAQSFFTGDFSGQTAGQNSSGNMGGNAGQGGGQGQSAFSAANLAAAQTDQIAIQSQGLSARGLDIRI